MIYDVIIIGGGTAGITAAVYLVRGGLKVLVFEKLFVGGRILNAPLIENYPGFKTGISGTDFAFNLKQQAEDMKIPINYEEVTEADLDSAIKTVKTSKGEYLALKVILAMGAEHKPLGLSEEESYVGRGVSYCAVCDGAFYRGKITAVVGGGNTAAREALFLSKICKKVYLIHRREFLRAERELICRLEETENIEIIYEAEATKLIGNPLSSVLLKTKDGERELFVSGLFVAVGAEPKSDIVSKNLKTDGGYIITDENMQTLKEGVYAVGDIREGNRKQLVFAAADGALAAEEIIKSKITPNKS